MRILGISAYYHDSAAALIVDGEIVAAAQEERFTRRKHDPRFPRHALAYCLREAGSGYATLTGIVFYDKPLLKFERLLETQIALCPARAPSICHLDPGLAAGKTQPQVVAAPRVRGGRRL